MSESETIPKAPETKSPESAAALPATGEILPEAQLSGIAGGNGFTNIVGEAAGALGQYMENYVPGVTQHDN